MGDNQGAVVLASKVQANWKLPEDIKKWVDEVAAKTGRNQGDIAAEALRAYKARVIVQTSGQAG